MGVFVDLCKAFDSLDRGLVLQKLHHYGLKGIILEWYRSYSSGTRQKAKLTVFLRKIERSYLLARLKYIIILGPLIFIVYL